MNTKKSIPETLASCKCLCCTDCAYGDECTPWTDCKQRNKLVDEYNYGRGKLGV